MIVQLNPTIPVETPKGRGECLAWFDYSKEDHLMWLVALDQNGEAWMFPNPDIRLCENYSIGRKTEVKCNHEWNMGPGPNSTFCNKCAMTWLQKCEQNL